MLPLEFSFVLLFILYLNYLSWTKTFILVFLYMPYFLIQVVLGNKIYLVFGILLK